MSSEQLGRLRVELDLRNLTDIYLCKVALVEVTSHYLAILHDVLVLQLLLGTEYIPCSVELLILCIDHLCLLTAFLGKVAGLGVQVVDSLIKSSDVDILAIQLLTKCLELLIFLSQLLLQVLDSLLELVALDRTVSQLLLQLSEELLVLLHASSNELHILLEFLSLGGTLAIFQEHHTVLSLIDLVETILNLIQSAQHIIQFAILLRNDAVERICLSRTVSGIVLAVVTSS